MSIAEKSKIDVPNYLSEVSRIYKTGEATEHSYRSALQKLFSSIAPDVRALNEPKRVKCGAPDFLVTRGEIVVGHVEAKDIGKDLDALKGAEAEQKIRYLKALPNLIYTNCLDFEFYKEGALLNKISIGDLSKGIQPSQKNFQALENQLVDFAAQRPQTITSSEKLAEIMAGKAVLIKDVLFRALRDDNDLQSELAGQYKAFKEHLIHDITPEDFADIYAETIAYGMFAARLHDNTLATFSRQEALELLPRSNPFLRSLFGYVAGHDLDDRIKWIIDDLADVFQAANVKKLMQNFGSLTGRNDPFLHFYETFLAKYNPAKRKARGVWYTPEAVVNFIIRGVDEMLQSEFDLTDGLADTSKVTIDWDTGQSDKKGKPITIKKQVHRVQILDPATGTGTFLAEAIKEIAPKVKGIAEGMWTGYVERDLIPRLHGFELLMASYAMCHLKLDMILGELGYKPSKEPPRLSVYLTNSLEEGVREVRDLFMAQWLTREAKEANNVKRQQPIMCVIGNPPYNIMSGNLSASQVALVDPYRYVDGKKIKEKGMLQFEKNINNDYIKFISFAEKLILKNGFGVIGFVTSHGYLKGASFRGLRQHLMKTFNSIHILDLHGNSEIREVPPEGVVDKNIFDIKQGVSVIIAVRKEGKSDKKLGNVFYSELWGEREFKYKTLFNKRIHDLKWRNCHPKSPNYTFHPSGQRSQLYEGYFSISEMMPLYSSGVITARDEFAISTSEINLLHNAKEFAGNKNLTDEELCQKLGISAKKGWDINKARLRMRSIKNYGEIIEDISYRPFDNRKILFDESVVWTTARSTMAHMMRGKNIALITARSEKSGTCSHFFVSTMLVETKCGERTTQSAVFPLYLYPEVNELDQERRANFAPKLWAKLRDLAADQKHGRPDEIETFDYIYGALHCPAYRAAYSEFLKFDFPRIPWPSSPKEFWEIAEKGGQLRRLHLMVPSAVGATPFPFTGKGDGEVTRASFEQGKIWINDSQCFEKVPIEAWEFFIGGYQPAQKWLKDRRGQTLSFDEVKHYQRILKVLSETHRIMKTIEMKLDPAPDK